MALAHPPYRRPVFSTILARLEEPRLFIQVLAGPELRGRLVETAVGAHLVNSSAGTDVEVFYWRDRGREVDFVVRAGRHITALEVKSGARPTTLPGMDAFDRAFSPGRKLLVGAGGIPLEDFFRTGPELFKGG
jgi:uncharacterized protein